jgi:hypothetical protein
MSRKNGITSRRAALVALLTSLALLVPIASASAATGPYGTDLGTWGARWWQWAFSQPADAGHPLFDETGANCMNGQPARGFVYLAGVFNASGVATRTDCRVPLGRALFVPVVNAECSSLEPEPFFGGNEAELSACLDRWSYADLVMTVDARSIPINRARSGVYGIQVPASGPNLLGVAPGSSGISMADGAYAVVPPPSRGVHDVHFSGTLLLDGSPAFHLDITYALRVG